MRVWRFKGQPWLQVSRRVFVRARFRWNGWQAFAVTVEDRGTWYTVWYCPCGSLALMRKR